MTEVGVDQSWSHRRCYIAKARVWMGDACCFKRFVQYAGYGKNRWERFFQVKVRFVKQKWIAALNDERERCLKREGRRVANMHGDEVNEGFHSDLPGCICYCFS